MNGQLKQKEIQSMAKKLPEDIPRKGERWNEIGRYGRTCRVMSDLVEGYVMYRFKGAMPYLLHVNDWHKMFQRKPKGSSPC